MKTTWNHEANIKQDISMGGYGGGTRTARMTHSSHLIKSPGTNNMTVNVLMGMMDGKKPIGGFRVFAEIIVKQQKDITEIKSSLIDVQAEIIGLKDLTSPKKTYI